MKKQERLTLAAFVGAGVATTLAASPVSATENPFAIKELGSGYAQTAEYVPTSPGAPAAAPAAPKESKESSCGEGKCGAEMMKKPEMKCGAGMKQMSEQDQKKKDEKAMEGKCAAGMKMP